MSKRPPGKSELERSMADFMTRLEENIKRSGQSIIFTQFETDVGRLTDLAYTVGLSDIGLPELFCFGLGSDVAQPLLNASAARLKANSLPLDTPVSEIANLQLTFKAVAPERTESYLNVANSRAGRALPAIQLVWPDSAGRFPWDADFEAPLRPAQPLLFDRL